MHQYLWRGLHCYGVFTSFLETKLLEPNESKSSSWVVVGKISPPPSSESDFKSGSIAAKASLKMLAKNFGI